MPTTPLDETEADRGEDGGSRQADSLETAETPLVLEPLGMSISIGQDEVASLLEEEEKAKSVTAPPAEDVSFWMLWRGPLLVYFVCLVLPTMSAAFMQEDRFQQIQENFAKFQELLKHWMEGGWCGNACATLKDEIYQAWIAPALEYICDLDETNWNLDGEPVDNYFSVSYWAHRMNLCPEPVTEEAEEIIVYRPVIAPDIQYEWKQDLVVTTAISTALTAMRLLVILVASWFTKSTTETCEGEKEKDASSADSVSAKPKIHPSKEDTLPGSALFRFACCAASAFHAWKNFHAIDFWPDFVFGTGNVDNCWNLIAENASDDSTYDHHNTILKYYVLAQASYYVHSVTFRLVRWMVRRRRRSSLIISFIQSVLALGLLALAYSFSSLRRLMAIGMFALDTSSAVRYLWQIFVPSNPREATLLRKGAARVIYWTLVLPSFVSTRFYVYPVLWQSAIAAEEWRAHLEEALWKGSADQFVRLCNVCIVLLLFVSAFTLHNLIELGALMRSDKASKQKVE